MNAIFAFGSNMNLRQMFTRCPSAKLLGPGMLRDYRLSFGSFSRRWNGAVATIVQSPGRRCYGLLFEISDRDLVALDGFEGAPLHYERITVPITRSQGGRAKRAFAYKLRVGSTDPPSAEYLGVIWDAYREWGFDADVLASAIEDACEGKEHLRNAREIAIRMRGRLRMGRRTTC